MPVHRTLSTDQIVLAVVSAAVGTLIIILLAIIFYLLRTRASTCTKPAATDEEKRYVLDLSKPKPPNGGSLISTVISEGKPGFYPHGVSRQDHLNVPPGQIKHSRVHSLSGGRSSPFVRESSASSSSIQTPRGSSIKDRRPSGSVSLTLSIPSSASQASVAGGPQKSSFSGRSTPLSRSNCDAEILMKTSKPLTVSELDNLVQNLNLLPDLPVEFMSLPANQQDRSEIQGLEKHKNRHEQMLPNNSSRIRLSGSRYRSVSSGYINANFISGLQREQQFIAAQGPLPSTLEDFWWMIWQENVSIVVMLTKLRERNKTMCEKYWPITNATFGDIVVKCEYSFNPKSKYQLNGFLIAEMESANQRHVRQYCYSDWPDKEVPEDASALFAMMEAITKHQREQNNESCETNSVSPTPPGPILVHCSAGIGRTGCYIALMSAIEKYETEGKIDILGTVAKLRLDRGGMVQTKEQYEFIHKALLQYIKESESKQRKFFTESGKEL
ncbi:tyrosine-protein phosphatase non-receptor type 7-like [Symsagittifera roscoffensis]|uniref:tyrosine-protein phosphatase non-receptor type 7-like n=1 Tax=Symsagittifera roscoffensis TaxID=84072 RepID=UPI00307BCB86